MKVPANIEELITLLQKVQSDDERSQILRDMAQVVPLMVVELLLSNVAEEESRQAILTTLNLFRPDLFEEYMEKHRLVLPETLEELEEAMEENPDSRTKVILLESLRQENPELFQAFIEKKRREIREKWT